MLGVMLFRAGIIERTQRLKMYWYKVTMFTEPIHCSVVHFFPKWRPKRFGTNLNLHFKFANLQKTSFRPTGIWAAYICRFLPKLVISAQKLLRHSCMCILVIWTFTCYNIQIDLPKNNVRSARIGEGLIHPISKFDVPSLDAWYSCKSNILSLSWTCLLTRGVYMSTSYAHKSQLNEKNDSKVKVNISFGS